jgi:spermine synthase
MAANSVLLDFSIEANRITDELTRKDIVKVIKEHVEKFFGSIKLIYDMLVDDGYLCILSDDKGVIFSLRFFNEGLITLNIEYYKKESEPQKISFEVRKWEIFFFLSLESHFTFQVGPLRWMFSLARSGSLSVTRSRSELSFMRLNYIAHDWSLTLYVFLSLRHCRRS